MCPAMMHNPVCMLTCLNVVARQLKFDVRLADEAKAFQKYKAASYPPVASARSPRHERLVHAVQRRHLQSSSTNTVTPQFTAVLDNKVLVTTGDGSLSCLTWNQ